MLLDTEEVAPGVTKVNLRGRLDAAGARALEGPFSTLARTQYDLLVDLSRVSFIASLGLRVLIAGARALAQHGGRMGVLRPDTAVEAVLISSGTDTLIPVFGDLSDAIRGVCGAHPDAAGSADTTRTFALQVPRSHQGTAKVGAWVDELASTLTLANRGEYALRLCLEEAVNLIVGNTAPAPPTDDGTILLRMVAEPTRLCVTIQDRGAAVNPLRADRSAGELEPLGGSNFGLGLMRQYAREVTWSRLGETNRLTLTVPR
jgi:anti-sigma B factor antagonist